MRASMPASAMVDTVPEDMVARRLSADIRWVIAASPDYLERYGTPEHPDDLLHHRCISNRLGDDRVYRWELARDGENIPNDGARLSDGQSCRNGSGGRIGRGWPDVFSGASCCTLCQGWTAPSGAYGMVPTGGRFSYLLFKPPAIADRASLLIEFIQEARPLGL